MASLAVVALWHQMFARLAHCLTGLTVVASGRVVTTAEPAASRLFACGWVMTKALASVALGALIPSLVFDYFGLHAKEPESVTNAEGLFRCRLH